jgi:hypothetical protein
MIKLTSVQMVLQKLLLNDTLGVSPRLLYVPYSACTYVPHTQNICIQCMFIQRSCNHLWLSSVPFLSGLSSSAVGSGSGEGVDASTVSVISEICERALKSDVAAAIAAASAVSGAVHHAESSYRNSLSNIISCLLALFSFK